jgi:hypothetical protein
MKKKPFRHGMSHGDWVDLKAMAKHRGLTLSSLVEAIILSDTDKVDFGGDPNQEYITLAISNKAYSMVNKKAKKLKVKKSELIRKILLEELSGWIS